MAAAVKTTLILADDHPIVRQGLRQTIEQQDDMEVLLECGDGQTAVEQTLGRTPDVVILDIDMPLKSGLEVLGELRSRSFKGKVIMLTVHSEEEFFDEALRLGAEGYVLKDSAVQDVVSAIRSVTNGQNYVSPALTALLFNQRSRMERGGTSPFETLTPTERQILKLIADYQTNNQIADQLFISPLTVKTHRRNIALKLGLEGNHALMKFAVEHKANF
jgi:DNA-binding NarL/FixJ family response regulator